MDITEDELLNFQHNTNMDISSSEDEDEDEYEDADEDGEMQTDESAHQKEHKGRTS